MKLFDGMRLGMLMVSVSFGLLAKDAKLTNIGQYFIKKTDMQSIKTFENQSHKTLMLRLEVADPHSDRIFVRHKTLPRGALFQIDLADALKFLGRLADKKTTKYGVDVYLGVVTKAPVAVDQDLMWRPLKGIEKGIRITQSDFLNNDLFALDCLESGSFFYTPKSIES